MSGRNGHRRSNDSIEPPKSVEAEEAIVGCALACPEKVGSWRDRLKPSHYFEATYGQLWSVMLDLDDEGIPPEVIAVSERLKQVSSEPPEHWARVMAVAMSYACPSHNFDHYAGIVLDHAYRREASYKLSQAARDMRTETIELSSIKDSLRDILDAEPKEKRPPRLKMRLAGESTDVVPQLLRAIVVGLLRLTETMNVISASKMRKSWLVLSLVLCVATGRKWLDKFCTHRGNVLVIDNELHQETLDVRLPRVARAMEIPPEEYKGRITLVNMRGELVDLFQLCDELDRFEYGQFDLIVLDAFYRFIPEGYDENKNGDMARLYNRLDRTASTIGCAFVLVHHSSKGNQSEKSVTDVGSGAGAQSRAADTHLVLRHHEVDGVAVVDAALRSWEPIRPFCIQWQCPTWTLAEHLDPNDLKTSRPRKAALTGLNDKADPEEERQRKADNTRSQVLQAYADAADGDTDSNIAAAAGVNFKRFKPVQSELLRSKYLEPCKVQKHGRKYDGNKLTTLGLELLRHSDTPTDCVSESDLSGCSGSHSDSSPPVRGESESESESGIPRLEDCDVFGDGGEP